jgi:hypothetical protein
MLKLTSPFNDNWFKKYFKSTIKILRPQNRKKFTNVHKKFCESLPWAGGRGGKNIFKNLRRYYSLFFGGDDQVDFFMSIMSTNIFARKITWGSRSTLKIALKVDRKWLRLQGGHWGLSFRLKEKEFSIYVDRNHWC